MFVRYFCDLEEPPPSHDDLEDAERALASAGKNSRRLGWFSRQRVCLDCQKTFVGKQCSACVEQAQLALDRLQSIKPTPIQDLGFEFLSALQAACVSVRAACIYGVGLGAEDWWRWSALMPLFTVPLQKVDVNIVCNATDRLDALWTSGMRNIAIVPELTTRDLLNKPLMGALKRYDEVWLKSPSLSFCHSIKLEVGINIIGVEPTPEAVLRRLP